MSEKVDTLELLGTLLHEDHGRDAVHIAVLPVEAGEKLRPGEHITVEKGIAMGTTPGNGVGIVDPYLPDYAPKGSRFMCMLYPRTIRSLRHVWTHPDFPDESPLPPIGAKAEAEAWLRAYADRCDVSYSRLFAAAETWLESESKWGEYTYTTEGGRDESLVDIEGFWRRYELVTGKSVPEGKREGFFSCSC